MSFQSARPGDGAGGESVFSKSLAIVATACGLAVSVLGTPPVFGLVRGWLLAYLTETWGPRPAFVLVWVMAVAIALFLFAGTRLLIVSVVNLLVAALSSRWL